MADTDTHIGERKLRVITHEMGENGGEKGLRERLTHEIETTGWNDEQKTLVYTALDDAARLHGGDTRGDLPALTHPLRVAIRILSPDHFNVRDRPELIAAALLHDTVEEHPERWVTPPDDRGQYPPFDPKEQSVEELQTLRNQAFSVIAERYGPRVHAVVHWLTSDLYPKETFEHSDRNTRQIRKWDQYETGVRALLHEEDAYGAKVIKLSDFIENFVGGIKHHENHALRPRLARKYIFLAHDMIAFAKRSRIIPAGSKPGIVDKIQAATDLAIDLIAQHVAEHPEDAELYDISHAAEQRLIGRTAVAAAHAA